MCLSNPQIHVTVCQDSLCSNAADTMPLPSHESESEHYCKRTALVVMGLGLKKYG